MGAGANINTAQRGQILDIGGLLIGNTRTILADSDTTLLDGDFKVEVKKTVAGATAISLPSSAGLSTQPGSKAYLIYDGKGDAGTNNITISAVGVGATIDGAATLVLNVNYSGVWLEWTGTMWHVLAWTRPGSAGMGAHAASHLSGGADDLLSSPGAIGGGTPGTGTFAGVTISANNNLTLASGSGGINGAGGTGAFRFGTSAATLGFFGASAAARTAAYTQTYSTATRTHSNLTAAALTHAVGTADGTVDDVGGAFNQTTLNNNFKELTAQIAALITDLTNIKGVVNSVIDDGQTYGLLQ